MITSTPVGEWSWDLALSPRTENAQSLALGVVKNAVDTLRACGLVHGGGHLDWSLYRNGADLRLLDRGECPLLSLPEGAGAVLTPKALEDVPEGLLANVTASCPGPCCDSGDRQAEKVFTVDAGVWTGGTAVLTVATYTDVWLTLDLLKNRQPLVHATHAPRLAAGLRALSARLGAPLYPGDPTPHAAPDETGFEDQPDDDKYPDSWTAFEIPVRTTALREKLPVRGDDYENETRHPVRFSEVHDDDGCTLGYLWVSLGDDAAGYEPRNAAGDRALQVAVPWLLRLREARTAGLSPMSAIARLRHLPREPETQTVLSDTTGEAATLEELQARSGRC
ncbi:hypothetical protein AB0910_29545 [Streptomyces sp. NPDC047002]|uniref:hypothetical protein n=1 Tax=Streptomyces sp. NPDC047002 TaxID=3155475 RepID=UPI003456C3A9